MSTGRNGRDFSPRTLISSVLQPLFLGLVLQQQQQLLQQHQQQLQGQDGYPLSDVYQQQLIQQRLLIQQLLRQQIIQQQLGSGFQQVKGNGLQSGSGTPTASYRNGGGLSSSVRTLNPSLALNSVHRRGLHGGHLDSSASVRVSPAGPFNEHGLPNAHSTGNFDHRRKFQNLLPFNGIQSARSAYPNSINGDVTRLGGIRSRLKQLNSNTPAAISHLGPIEANYFSESSISNLSPKLNLQNTNSDSSYKNKQFDDVVRGLLSTDIQRHLNQMNPFSYSEYAPLSPLGTSPLYDDGDYIASVLQRSNGPTNRIASHPNLTKKKASTVPTISLTSFYRPLSTDNDLTAENSEIVSDGDSLSTNSDQSIILSTKNGDSLTGEQAEVEDTARVLTALLLARNTQANQNEIFSKRFKFPE